MVEQDLLELVCCLPVLMALNEIEKTKDFYEDNKNLKIILDDFTRAVELQFKNVLSIVLFGSYAKGTATKASDIDILLIKGKGNIKIEKLTREIYAKYGKEISPIVISQQDFRKQRSEAIVHEIIKNHYVLYGAENFISMVFRNEITVKNSLNFSRIAERNSAILCNTFSYSEIGR